MSDRHGFAILRRPPDTPVTTDSAAADQPQRERIIETIVAAGVKFWRDPDGNAFATVPCKPGDADGPARHLRVRARSFSVLVRQLYGSANPVNGATGTRPGSVSDNAMSEALPAFEAMALNGEIYVPGVRTTKAPAVIFVDIGDDTHRVIRVTADGWNIQDRSEVPLVRSNGMRALPIPAPSGDALDRLRDLVNLPRDVSGDVNFRLIMAWLVQALYPIGPYPVLAVDGEQGSGKSTVCRMLRRLVDPNAADLRAMPRNEDDLLIAAANGQVVGLDNVSHLEPDMADALCRVATGAGFGKRALFTDLGETIVSVCRPVLLNGIPSLLSRGDLADRAIAITLPHIPDDKRRPEELVWADFYNAAPGIFAMLLDGLATVLRRLPLIRLDRLPRMADFARIALAAAPAFGWSEMEMWDALEANRAASVETVVEADPIAEAVRSICYEHRPLWQGIASELLDAINAIVPIEIKNERGWPKDAARLSTRLRRVAPALRRAGVDVELPTHGGREGRRIFIRPQR